MINILDHEKTEIAEMIYHIWQVSYAVEAELLKADDFPPLRRTVTDFLGSDTSFFGYWEDTALAAVIEIDATPTSFHICSLVVDPAYFRLGIAKKLLTFMFQLLEGNTITVETGLANTPAVSLYEGFGFKKVKEYDTSHGIRKVRFKLDRN